MRVLVTGAGGVIGKSVVSQLVNDAIEVVVVDNPADGGLDLEAPNLRVLHADPAIPGVWQKAVDGCDFILHLLPAVDEAGTSEAVGTDMESLIDATFQIVWAIEQAEHPPRGLFVQLRGGASKGSDEVSSSVNRRIKRVLKDFRRTQVPVVVHPAAGPATPPDHLRTAIKRLFAEAPASQPGVSRVSGMSMVLSLDEFLLQSGRSGADAVQLLRHLRARGVCTVLTTSSSPTLALAALERFGTCDLVIAAEGSALVDPVSREVIRTELLSAEQVMGIGLAVRTAESSIGVQVERGLHAYSSFPRPVPPRLDWLLGGGQPVPFSESLQRPATRILLFGTARRLARSLELIRESWVANNLVQVIRYAPDCVGVLAVSAQRGLALEQAESILGVPRHASMVIAGQQESDLLQDWPHSCTWAGMPEGILRRVAFVLPSEPPPELAELLIRAMDRVQPSTGSH
ncbi:MAG: hypothetical protein CBC35_05510 [Planctomycetes bacterium TMED75]|nr:hypothetical protein [Planctomycetaceae bacterium]OUU93388.1 MAG: hypothetical protein CBC35_05510 [Planctomycetes bacterium TMED75]